jgi:integrase/recombinase XerD
LLACRPLRLGNLTAITLGRHLQQRGNAWCLQFGAAETKERWPIEMSWPAILTPLLEQYLSVWWPRLLRVESDALWISNRGRPMTEQAIYCQVVQVTKTMLGRPVKPHLFRDSALTAAAEHSPEQVALGSPKCSAIVRSRRASNTTTTLGSWSPDAAIKRTCFV